MKAIIFDSSTLISFAMNGILDILRELKKNFKGSFVITQEVKKEVIDKPLTIKRFALEALKIQGLMEEGVLELPEKVGVKSVDVTNKTADLLEAANNIFVGRKKDIKIISSGEASCLALSKLLEEKKILNVVAIDERTTRVLVEDPENLRKFLQRKMHMKISFDKKDFSLFKGFRIIRSAELVYVAYKKKLVKVGRQRGNPLTTSSKRGQSNGKLLDALLWALKFKGCSISGEEISEIERLK